MVFVHGGGWKNGSKNSARSKAAWLVEHDFAVAGIQYRLTDVAQWPAQINDCYAAVRWLRDNADKYQLDAKLIGAWGTSAGGHLVALMGTRRYPGAEETSSQVSAVCDWFGPSDLLTMPPNNVGNGRTEEDIAKSNGAKLLGATVRDVPKLAHDASALQNVSGDDAAFLIMHGDKDPGVPLAQSERLHKALRAAGVSSQLVVLKGAGHGGKSFSSGQSKATVVDFFTRALKPSWSQGAGPAGDFRSRGSVAPTEWSVVRNENIKWRTTLPETGQSTVVVHGDRLFFTTMKPVEEDSSLGTDIVAYCCDASTGKILWQRDVAAEHPLRLSGCFSDSSSPPAVTDGQCVCFFNASGTIACFDMQGEPLWQVESMAVGRSQPFLVGGNVIYTKQTYMPDGNGHFTHEHKNAPLGQWTQLQALNLTTGEPAWTSKCGVNMGCVPLPLTLQDGRRAVAVGRGGGHSPPEKPEGVSLIDVLTGETLWTLELPNFMSTQTFGLHGEHLLIFHRDEHLWVNAETGSIDRRVSFTTDVPLRAWNGTAYESRTISLPPGKKPRSIIQQSNLLVGDYHYFRSYTQPHLGRVHVPSGKVELLQLPTQLKRTADSQEDQLLWDGSKLSPIDDKGKKSKLRLITQWAFAPNDMKNSRGFVVLGDSRSRGVGWGHHASAVPTVAGEALYVPTMSGTVYVLRWNHPELTEDAIIAMNDLGPVGQSWNRASLSACNGRLYAHTIGEVICIGD